MLTCKDASRLVSEALERKLGFREWLGLRFHLLLCEACRRFERQMVALHRVLRELARRAASGEIDPIPAEAFTPERRERIRKALAAHCKPAQ